MITNNTNKNKCSRCGQCCNAWNPITMEEYYKIKDYIQENNIKQAPIKTIKDDIYITCPFNTPKGCSIYPVRPAVCRKFSCSLSEDKLSFNRSHFDSIADINGTHLNRFIPFDLLFYDNPLFAILIAHKMLDANTPAKLVETLRKLGGDRRFFNNWQLPSCWDIADAIERHDITLEWSDTNDGN